jgi:peptidoglycan/xylan/chitin deacetylase (PgdA/CDA1 family)
MNTEPPSRPSPQSSIALMYHALSDGEHPSGQDPQYTLTQRAFAWQMDRILESGSAGSARELLVEKSPHRVAVTFDDGHASNYRIAFPELAIRGISADFFINPAMVGTTGFAHWHELREMSDAGMSIQSHGYDHVYLTSLGPKRLQDTLRAAREEISERMGRQATLLAPPGGRMPRDLAAVAKDCGYTQVLSSRPGLIEAAIRYDHPLPRMAMTTAIDEVTFDRWINRDRIAIGREQLRYTGLAMAKRLLGDHRYERARARALGLLRGPA